MTNNERLRRATELLAARGEGFADGLRWVLREIDDARAAEGCWPDIVELSTEIELKLEKPNGQRSTETQAAEEDQSQAKA